MPAMAITPSTPTTAMPTTTQTHVFTLPATATPHQTAGVGDAGRIAAFLTERLGALRQVASRNAIAAAYRQPRELGVGASTHPILRVGRGRRLQVGPRLVHPVESPARCAALVSPERLFTGHPG